MIVKAIIQIKYKSYSKSPNLSDKYGILTENYLYESYLFHFLLIASAYFYLKTRVGKINLQQAPAQHAMGQARHHPWAT